MKRTHFIAMGGIHGCLPDMCSAYSDLAAAVESLSDLYELTEEQTRELKDSQYLELGADQGGDYCEITECDCSKPWEHEEDSTPDDWPEYVKEHIQEFVKTLDKHEYGDWIKPEYKHREHVLYLLPYASF